MRFSNPARIKITTAAVRKHCGLTFGDKMKIPHTTIITKNGSTLYGGNQALLPKKYHKTACGMIAACDVALCRNISESDYIQYVENAAGSHFYKHSRNIFGIPPRKIIKYLKNNIENVKFRFINHILLNKERLISEIEKSLSRNIPVIVRIGENRKRLPYRISFGKRIASGKMRWHYITVTGIEKDKLFFSSWGGEGEMRTDDLIRFFGFTGGIIVPA